MSALTTTKYRLQSRVLVYHCVLGRCESRYRESLCHGMAVAPLSLATRGDDKASWKKLSGQPPWALGQKVIYFNLKSSHLFLAQKIPRRYSAQEASLDIREEGYIMDYLRPPHINTNLY